MKHIQTHALPGISRQQLRAADTSAAASTSAPRGRVAITIAVMLSISLSALDLTIVSTAMPTIASELGGFAFYSWVFSAYLLTSTSMVPIFGRLADKLGRRHAFVISATLFILGSALCGSAQTMTQLIVFRGLQGLGAGGLFPVGMTIIGDVYAIEERGRIQPLLNSVWGVASIAGPLIGGLIVSEYNWRWIFLLNVPAGVAAVILMSVALREHVELSDLHVDWRGAAVLIAAVATLLRAIGIAGRGGSDAAPQVATYAGISILLLALLLWIETRASDPVIPLRLFRNRMIAAANAGQFLACGVLYGMVSFVPLFVQNVMGSGAILAGLAIAPISLGWAFASWFAGVRIISTGVRRLAVAGMSIIAISTLMLVASGTPRYEIIFLSMLVAGVGFGMTSTVFLLGVQHTVDWNQRGAATASLEFAREIGGSVWVAVMGGIANSYMISKTGEERGLAALADMSGGASMVASHIALLRHELRLALDHAFWLAVGLAISAFMVTMFLPATLQAPEEEVETSVVKHESTRTGEIRS